MGQLYGEFDPNTREWTDGIVSTLMRIGAAATDMDQRWYILDGPVDAVWIENMNTLLDDNKKLCLTSGEIIKLSNYQRMIFEVADLAVASPATVSRCGMVYLEPAVLGLQPFLNCWLKRLPSWLDEQKSRLMKLLQDYLLPAVQYLRGNLKEIVVSVDSALVQCFLNLMNYRFRLIAKKDSKPIPSVLGLLGDLLAPCVLFSVIWSVGATCDAGSREKFSSWLKQLQIGKEKNEGNHGPLFPSSGLVYDYRLNDGGENVDQMHLPQWINWLEGVEEVSITNDMKYSDIEVPTLDSIRSAELLGMLLVNENNVLCVGPTGTGKTQTISSKLSKDLPKQFLYDFIIFSARTNARQVQNLIDSKLDKRRRGIYGPPLLKRQIFFIDDLNMPALEVYGAQPPIELIRQWMDFNGWYDSKEVGVFRQIVDSNFVAAMCPPGGGRNPVTLRLLRHFHYLAFTEIQTISKTKIFSTILKSWITRTDGLSSFLEPTVEASLMVYTTILQELLPTPAKTHYTFNLRDLSRVFQGILMREAETLTDKNELFKLWYHENCRVYQDRMVNDHDRSWFDKLLHQMLEKVFQQSPEVLGSELICFGDFMDVGVDVRRYLQVTDMDKAKEVLENYLGDYNIQTTKPMKLVLFMDAILHVNRVARILRQPLGNALLLGMGGSGRQSVTRLASFISEYVCFQIELSKSYGMTEWREDLKKCLLGAGLLNKYTTFLFSDTQIKSESFLEDLNNILNSGDVPNIYKPEELDRIYNGMTSLCQELQMQTTKTNLFSIYQKNVKNYLHTVITMSPIGEIFRSRLRQFPALVNCCNIDWFSSWPDTALQSVAYEYLSEVPDIGKDQIAGLVTVIQYMHQSVITISDLFLQELNRHNYVTPTSYLELLSSFITLIKQKKEEFKNGIVRLQTGMDKMDSTEVEVKELQIALEAMKPKLEAAVADAEIMIAAIAKDTIEAEKTRVVVEEEEKVASNVAAETQAIADSAQKDLDEALPALRAAEESLKSLNKNDVTEVRAMKRPPAGVIKVMETICIINDIKPLRVPGPKFGEKLNDYWQPAQAMLADPGAFLSGLMNFDKSRLTQEKIDKLKPYVMDPTFSPQQVIKVSKACTSLCMWAHAMYKYYFVDLAVAPKKAALAKAKEKLDEVLGSLAKTKARMKLIMDGLDALNQRLQVKIKFREAQESEIQLCVDRKNRAVRLLTGLADEKIRWVTSIKSLEDGIVNLTGDILISSGAIAYITPFTSVYRQRLFSYWLRMVEDQKIPHSQSVTPVTVLGDPVIIRLWQIDGLPRDAISTENAVLVKNSRRWPLFIDPQGQANKWIRNMGKPLGMFVVKLSDRVLIRTLESAIRFGKPVLIENVGAELDPALDPILTKQIFKQAGQELLKLGDVVVPYNEDFRLYITSTLGNPHFTPEVSIKVMVVNFTLVSSGLQDQLLAMVVAQERPDLEELRNNLLVSSATMKHELKEIEDRILLKLSSSQGSPVDDIDLIVTLEASKIKSDDIKAKVAISETTQADIDITRTLYIPVANRGAILFFCCADLATVDPMYQYSLEWFKNIFAQSMSNTEKSDDIMTRISVINQYLTFSLYSNVCRSLFERNKIHFAFLVCARILMDEKKIIPKEWKHLLAGGDVTKSRPNPAPKWLEKRAWTELQSLESLPRFAEFCANLENQIGFLERLFKSHKPQEEEYPEPYNTTLDSFQKMCILKCIRPENVINAMQNYIADQLEPRFIEPQTTDLQAIYNESSPTIPLVFILSAGTDPATELYKFAEKLKMGKRLLTISLGQGQGPKAEAMLEEAEKVGYWVFFQNCHLAPSWMPQLERLIDQITIETVHKDMRIWLTSTPTPHFPVSILQNSSKITMEPPRGVKANLLKAFRGPVNEFADFLQSKNDKVSNFKFLLFSICLFHGVILERRKFGALGFNIPYEFTDGDLSICMSQLHMFLMEYQEVPFKVLSYTAGQINYGGRITDDWDRRCLMTILKDYYRTEVMMEGYVFDKLGAFYQLPSESSLEDFHNYFQSLPINDEPELFGLHPNADITFARASTFLCLSTLLQLQPREAVVVGQSSDEVTEQVATAILEGLPPILDQDYVAKKYPIKYEESLNTVLGQEVIRYNRLLRVIRESLSEFLKALKGLIVMSDALEDLSKSLFTNIIPEVWKTKAYPSLKPLAAWIKDFQERVHFMNTWIKNGIPPAFWISGFFFPQAFLTGTLQNYARKHVLSVDSIAYSFQVLKSIPEERKSDGCCIYGLFLEGARFELQIMSLTESRPKELYTEMPCLWLVPQENHVIPGGAYECPVYKTLTRSGTLSTTGHSTNYVLTIEVPSKVQQEIWIKRGVALFCALNF